MKKFTLAALALAVASVAFAQDATELQEANISYSDKEASYTLQLSNLNASYQLPYLANYTDPRYDAFTYTSSDPTVATVNVSGEVAPKAVGTTTITCAWEANDIYLAGSTSYVLTVNPIGYIYGSKLGADFKTEGTAAYDDLMGLKFAAGEEAAASAVSPAIKLPYDGSAVVSFNSSVITPENLCTVAVRTAASYSWDGTEVPAGEWATIGNASNAKGITIPDSLMNNQIELGFFKAEGKLDTPWMITNIAVNAPMALLAEKQAALGEINKYYALTQQAKDYGEMGFAYQLTNAGTQEEINKVVADALSSLAQYALNELGGGFIWKSGNGYVIIEDGKAVIAPKFSTDAVWNAQRAAAESWSYMSDDATAEPSQNSFYLNNALTGQYLTVNDGTFGFTATKDDATVFVIVAAGDALNLAIDATPSQFVTVTDAGFAVTTDTSAFDYLLPSFTDGRIFVSAIDATFNEWGSPNDMDEIKGFTLSIPMNAAFTGLGSLSVLYDGPMDPVTYQSERITLERWTAETIQALAPVETEQTYTANPRWTDTGMTCDTITVPCLTYTLMLKNVITEPNYYFAMTNDMMFSVKTPDGETAPEIPEFFKAGSFNVRVGSDEPQPAEGINFKVTPEEGAVDSLINISLQNADDIILDINWEGDADAVISIYRDEESGEPNIVKTFSKDNVSESMAEIIDYFNDPQVYILAADIVEDGTYTMVIPAEFFHVDYYYFNEETYLTWTIESKEDGTLTITPAATSTAIYNLQGRRSTATARGLYIHNGKVIRK